MTANRTLPELVFSLSLFLLAASSGTALAAATAGAGSGKDAKKNPIIESIEGADVVTVLSGQAKRNAKRGTELAIGDRVQTGDNAAVTLVYADGSRVIVSRQSDYQVEGPIKGTEWNRLREGSVRGVITKLPAAAGAAPAARPKFLIRSKAATMGVRGTDFVMGLDPNTGVASVHTLEGLVDVAPNESALFAAKGASLPAGQAIEATRSGMGTPKEFDRDALLKAFESGAKPSELSKTISGNLARAGGPGIPIAAPPIGGMGLPSIGGPSLPSFGTSAPTSAPIFIAKQEPPKHVEDATNAQNARNADDAKHAKEADQARYADGGHRTKILNVQPAVFLANGKLMDKDNRALSILWTPTLAFPVPLWPYLRGAAGGLVGNGMPWRTREASVLFGTALLRPIFVEAGYGVRRLPDSDTRRMVSVNIGWVSNYGGILDRFFIGTSRYTRGEKNTEELKAGVGIAF